MLRAFSTAATGMIAQQKIVDVTANTLANINTTGFKRSQADFQDLMYVKLAEPGRQVAEGIVAPSGFEIGSGVGIGATIKIFTPGEIQSTDNPLDLAIQGDGFFQITLPNGSNAYTRDGALKLNANGDIVTSDGYSLGVSVGSDAVSIGVGKDGTISIKTSSGSMTTAGPIALYRFTNPAGLSSMGGNLLMETSASGSATSGTAGDGGFGSILSGHLEKSNVQMITELVNLITAQRAYEVNSRAIKAGDQMLTTANRMIS